jgi:hypothetical protein
MSPGANRHLSCSRQPCRHRSWPRETLDHGDLEVFHFPARSYAQFERKVVNSGSAYEANTRLPPGVGNAQRWLYRIYKAGDLRRYYESQVLDEATLSRRLASGEIVEDTRLRDFFRALNR